MIIRKTGTFYVEINMSARISDQISVLYDQQTVYKHVCVWKYETNKTGYNKKRLISAV